MAETPTLKLYNTLTREKAEFQPIDPANVRMYVCGPTVYDFAHIGNARPVIVFDVLYRLLRHLYGADHVTYVRNITDLDDKINARALRDHPGLDLNEAIRLVTESTESQFQQDVKALGCLEPTHQPRATENIPQMVEIIQRLIEAGHAYLTTGGGGREVLFSTGSMPDYGQLSKRRLDEQQAGARIAVEAHKRNPADFVLWKESAGNEPGWPAEFTVEGQTTAIFGRPGWHIECSAMADRFLWEEIRDRLSPAGKAKPHQFDIHGGGLDLIFPHHENEIAQSRCAHGTSVMANVWMHNGFLQVEGRKMSKSEGNFVTIHELLHTEKFGSRRWPGEVLRLAMLMTHYREPIDFSVKRLEEAENLLARWRRTLSGSDTTSSGVPKAAIEALADDLNTPQLFRLLSTYAATANRTVFAGGEPEPGLVSDENVSLSAAALMGTLDLLGIRVHQDVAIPELDNIISERLSLLKSKNFAEADKIRDELLAKGIQLKDGKDPATGERVTTWEVKR